LALALYEPNDEDSVFEEKEFTFCINKDLIEKSGKITIDLSYMGFVVESENPLGGGSSCGGCSSAGSCG